MSNPNTDDKLASLYIPEDDVKVRKETKTGGSDAGDNFKGVVTAGWVLAIVLPFLGIFLNTWLVKNSPKYDYSRGKAIIPLVVSIVLSAILLSLLIPLVVGFATP